MSGKIIGYARVSSKEQQLYIQLDALKAYGCVKIFSEKVSGTTAARTEYQKMKHYLREGDTIVVSKLDRLARSVLDLNKFMAIMESRGVRVVILNMSLDTATPCGKMMVNMLAAVAEFENELRKERQEEGIKRAMENGIKFGRKAKLTREQQTNLIKARHLEHQAPVYLAQKFGISQASVYRLTAWENVQLFDADLYISLRSYRACD
jgi:DNA invertase Pin-like site-specific DNA recombinase